MTRLNAIGQLASLTPVPGGPWAIAALPADGIVLVVAFGARELSFIASNGLRGPVVPVGAGAWSIAASDGRAWVTNSSDHTVTIVDTADQSTFSVAAGNTPRGVAVGGESAWVVSSGSQELLRLDGDDGTIITSYPIGVGADAVIFDQDRVFVANREDRTISLIAL